MSLRFEHVFRGPTVALWELFMQGALTWTVLLEPTEDSELRPATAGTGQYDRFSRAVLLGCVLCSKKELGIALDCWVSDRLSNTFGGFADFVSTSSILPLKLIERYFSGSLRCAMRRTLSTWAYKSMQLSSSDPSPSFGEGESLDRMLAIFANEVTIIMWIPIFRLILHSRVWI